MRLPDDPTKFTAKFQYREFGKYVEKAFYNEGKDTWAPGVIRDNKKHQAAILYSWEEIEKRVLKYNNTGVYTSVFQYDGRNAEKSQSLSSLYFDLDSKDINISHREAQKLYHYLLQFVPEEAIRLYFTGMKGFHLECEAISLGIGPSGDLAEVFRYIANAVQQELVLESIDFAVYDPRRLWRLPNSRHQSTGLYKVPLHGVELDGSIEDIRSIAGAPRQLDVPEQQFSPKANEWFREFIYAKAKPTFSQEEMLERFAKYGTGMVRDRGELQFDPSSLFSHCPSILRLWKKAETEHHLLHEERLFLCSILTYSESAIEYLHAILQNCSDYNREKSESHIQDWIRRREIGIGGRPYSCARANSAGVGCGECNLEAKERYQVVGDRMVPTGEMASPSPVRFGYRRKEKK